MRRCITSSTLRGSFSSRAISSARSLAAPAHAHASAQPDASVYRSKQGGSFEEALDINVVDVEDLFNPASGYWENPANWNDMDYVWKLKVERLQQELNIPAEQTAKFRKEHDISKGYLTLEWILPSPPPEHTFEELPILKETEEELATSFEARAARLLESAHKAKTVSAEHTQTFESLAQEFNFSDREKTAFKELLNRYAKGQTPSFPNEYEEHAHDEHH